MNISVRFFGLFTVFSSLTHIHLQSRRTSAQSSSRHTVLTFISMFPFKIRFFYHVCLIVFSVGLCVIMSGICQIVRSYKDPRKRYNPKHEAQSLLRLVSGIFLFLVRAKCVSGQFSILYLLCML